jgi:uncharacterized protein
VLEKAQNRSSSPTSAVGVELERDVSMQTRDGVKLKSDLYRPLGIEECPVLLLRTPYDKGWPQDGTYLHPAWYARQGFIVVVQDTRGRYASEGEFVPFVHEAEDGYDAVEWAAGLEGSNGSVGMYGASYAGGVQLLAAVEAPPHLGAIAPAVTSADARTAWIFEGGALNLEFAATWSATLAEDLAMKRGDVAMARRVRDLIGAGAGWLDSAAAAELEPLAEAAPFYRDWIEHGDDDAFWQQRSAVDRLADVHVPALHIAGWYDIFLEGSLDAFRRLSAGPDADRQFLLVGPWHHYPWGDRAGERRFQGGAGTPATSVAQVEFFNHFLRDEGAFDRRPVRYYVMFGEGWKDAPSWPPPQASEVSYFLSSDGAANTAGGDGRLDPEAPDAAEPCDVYHYYPRYPVPAHGGHSCCDPELTAMGCRDQTAVEEMTEVLVYTSEPAMTDTVFAGAASVELFVATDAASADYTAKLCVVDHRGSWNVAQGIRRLSTGELASLRDGDGVAPVVVHLRSTAFRLAPGCRLRLDVSSGAFPAWDRNPQTGDPPATTPPEHAVGAMHAVFHEPGRASRLLLSALGEAN